MAKIRDEAKALREKPVVVDDSPPTTDDSVRSAVSTETPIPDVPRWGVHDVEIDFDEVFPYLDRHVLFKLHWGGRGVKGEAWRKVVEGDGEEEGFTAKLDRMWAEQDYLHPRARIGYFPCNADGNELVIFDPDDHDVELERLVFPRQPKHDRICLSRLLPAAPGGLRAPQRDVVALQGVTVGPEVTKRIEQPRARRRVRRAAVRPRARGPIGGGSRRVAARPGARGARDRSRTGPALLMGLPGLPGSVRAREGLAPARAREHRDDPLRRLRGQPEQSTVAIIAHHPQAVYFGMKSGFVPAEPKSDELIAGTDRGGELPPDEDLSDDGTIASEVDGAGESSEDEPEAALRP